MNHFLSTFVNHIRVQENNDWVVFILLGSMFLLIFMMQILQRDTTFKEFFLQDINYSGNGFLSWGLVSLVFCIILCTSISQYIPIIPKFWTQINVLGLELNKFGYVFLVICSFYLLKCVLSFIFYHSVGEGKSWDRYYFANTKFYFMLSILLMIFNVVQYFYEIDRGITFTILTILLCISFIFKVFYKLFYRGEILPKDWYYKFLYICTLQIMPIIALWKILFF